MANLLLMPIMSDLNGHKSLCRQIQYLLVARNCRLQRTCLLSSTVSSELQLKKIKSGFVAVLTLRWQDLCRSNNHNRFTTELQNAAHTSEDSTHNYGIWMDLILFITCDTWCIDMYCLSHNICCIHVKKIYTLIRDSHKQDFVQDARCRIQDEMAGTDMIWHDI